MSEPNSTIDMDQTLGTEIQEREPTPPGSNSSHRELTDQERESLFHHVVYGQPNFEPPTQRTLAPDWHTNDFITPVTSPFEIILTKAQVERLKLGFQPQAMEDKWFIFADGDEKVEQVEGKNGEMRIHFFRSWTGNKIFEVVVELENVEGGEGGGKIKELIWESSKERDRIEGEEKAKETVIEICRWILGVELRSEEQIQEQERKDEGESMGREVEEQAN